MDPLSVVASIIALLQLTNKVIGYLNDVKDASKDRARCAVETSNLYSLLTNLRFRLEDEDADTPWFVAIRALTVQNGPLDQFKEALELLHDGMTSGKGHLAHFTEPLVWKFKKHETERILQSIERLKTLIAIALQMDHFKLSQAIKNDTGLLITQISTIESSIESLRLDHDRTLLDDLRNWLSQTDFPTQQTDILRRRREGTGQWFLDTPQFADWSDASNPKATLLCTGIPGAGKTMLAAVAIDLLSAEMASSTVAVAYLYCSYKSRNDQSIETILAAILQQLLQPNRPDVVKVVTQLYEQHITQGTRPSAAQLQQTLLAAFADYSCVYMVIDALDECSADDGTRGQLLGHLQGLRCATNLRVLITSRHLPDIVQEFTKTPRVEIRAHEEDVKLFLAGEIHRLPRCIQRDAELQGLVQDKIVAAIDGMFLLARLYVDSLMDKRTKSKVQTTLDSLAAGSHMLEKAYEDALERLKSQLPGDAALAMRVLTYIVYAESALTTSELCHALAIEPGQSSFDPDNILDIQDIVTVCAGLVSIDEDSGIIRLVHHTAYEYFWTLPADWSRESQLDITRTCLTYLAFDVFKTGSCSTDAEFEQRLEDYPFLDYAALHWGAHAMNVQLDVFDLACSVLLDENLLSSLLQAAVAPLRKHSRKPYNHRYPKGRVGLHVTAGLGLRDLAEGMLANFEDNAASWIATRDNNGRTPLYVAAAHGHDSVLKVLLDRNADPNVHGGNYDYPLIAAVLGNHREVVTLLLKHGADSNLRSEEFGTALHTAFRESNRDLVRVLIDAGAEIPVTDSCILSPLHMAALNSWHDVVQSLLDRRTTESLAQADSRGCTLLYSASVYNQVELVELLLKKGVSVGPILENGSTPIQVASESGHLEIVKLLLQIGKDKQLVDGSGTSPLHRAAFRGHLEVAKLLLDHGAILNAPNVRDITPFHVAAGNGHLHVVDMLLERGADINARDKSLWSALYKACFAGELRTVQYLLEKGADIALGDIDGTTPISVAASYGYVDIVTALLAHGADISITNSLGWCPITMAAEHGQIDVVKLLLPLVEDINNVHTSHETFFSMVIRHGHLDLLRLAQEKHNADLHRIIFHGRTLLHVAIRYARVDAFSYLLGLGLDPTATDAMGDGLLRFAASSRDVQTCNLILDQMPARPERIDCWGPLHWACRKGAVDVIERLIRANIPCHTLKISSSSDAWSPTDIAVFHGHAAVLDKLSDTAKGGLGARANGRLRGVYHKGVVCDACDHSLVGTRYQCQTCPDFDYCFMCKPFLDHLHEGHGWNVIESPVKTGQESENDSP